MHPTCVQFFKIWHMLSMQSFSFSSHLNFNCNLVNGHFLIKMYVVAYETSSKWTLFNMRFIAMFITAVCVLFLIKLRWPKKKSVYDVIYDPPGGGGVGVWGSTPHPHYAGRIWDYFHVTSSFDVCYIGRCVACINPRVRQKRSYRSSFC